MAERPPEIEAPGRHSRLVTLALAYREAVKPSVLVPARVRAAGEETEEAQLVAAAVAQPSIASLAPTVSSLEGGLRLLTALFLGVALVAGFLASQALLHADRTRPVNIVWLLGILLGPQLLLLAVSIVAMVVLRRAPGFATVSSLLLGLWSRAARAGAENRLAAARAVATLYGARGVASSTMMTIFNGAWTHFNVGCLASLAIVLTTHQYSFCWESTWLSSDVAARAIEAVAAGPEALGFRGPSPEDVARARFEPDHPELFVAQDESTRRAWGSMLIGVVLLYGLLPRAVLAVAGLVWRRRAIERWRLDLEDLAVDSLNRRLTPKSVQSGASAATAMPDAPSPPAAAPARPRGRAALMQVEVSPPVAWPAEIRAAADDLGAADSREERDRLVRRLEDGAEEPGAVVIAVALTSTPDRGIGSFLREVRSAVASPMRAVLSAGQAQRERGGSASVEKRLEQWRSLLRESGIEECDELDLAHVTERTIGRLKELVGAGAAEAAPLRIHEAISVLRASAVRWLARGVEPDVADEGRLHQELVELYRARRSALWPDLHAVRNGDDLRRQLQATSDRVLKLLPASLRGDPRWIAAGAAGGILACASAALLISPVAIGALPLWSVVGAALGAVRMKRGAARGADDGCDVLQPLRSGALTAILLESQGLGEAAVGRVLEETLTGLPSDPMLSELAVNRWVGAFADRATRALREEGRS